MTPNVRRVLAFGALVLVVLLGIGLWPRHVFLTRTEQVDAVGAAGTEEVTWNASADCSILLGEYRVETYRRPPSSFLPEGSLCGNAAGPRTALIAMMVLTATATIVALIWTYAAVPDAEVRDEL